MDALQAESKGYVLAYDKTKAQNGQMLGNCGSCFCVGTFGYICGECGHHVTVFCTRTTWVINPFIVAKLARQGPVSTHQEPSTAPPSPRLQWTYRRWDVSNPMLLGGAYARCTSRQQRIEIRFKCWDLYEESWQKIDQNFFDELLGPDQS